MLSRSVLARIGVALTCFTILLWASSWSGGASKIANSVTNLASSISSTVPAQNASESLDLQQTDSISTSVTDPTYFPKPGRIAAFILAGRREFISTLHCYLERNLVRNGGWLDEVVWIIRTNDEEDRFVLYDLVDGTAEYTSFEFDTDKGNDPLHYDTMYKTCRNDTIYIKIDDDVLFWEDHTIPAIVQRLVENPQFSGVSANIVNQPGLSWVHYHLGTALPFAPEVTKPLDFVELDQPSSMSLQQRLDWRPSSLPPWTGPSNFTFDWDYMQPAPFKHHRWLPLSEDVDIEDTPMGQLGEDHSNEYSDFGVGWKSWMIAAQEHMSFLTHLENNELYRYNFDIWHSHYERVNINFYAFHGSLVQENTIEGQDEAFLTETLAKRLKRPAVYDGAAVAVHFAFFTQYMQRGETVGRALNDTDILYRYKSFADEFICGKPIGSSRP